MALGFFIALCITAMTLVCFFAPSDNVPVKGTYDPGFKEILLEGKAGESPLKVSAFYPVKKKAKYFPGKEKKKGPRWCPDGDHTTKGL